MLKNLIIINAGNFGREVYAWARQVPQHGTEWKIKGFLDNRKDILNNYNYEVPILSAPEDYEPGPDDLFVCSIGYPKEKKEYCDLIMKRGGNFTNIIHPTAVMAENVKIGIGVILCPYVVVSADTVIGNFVSVNLFVSVGHDVTIGDYCQINPNASLGGYAVIGESVDIGSNAAVLPEAVVEESATVGAGSVVLRKVNANQTVFGVPAKPVALPKK